MCKNDHMERVMHEHVRNMHGHMARIMHENMHDYMARIMHEHVRKCIYMLGVYLVDLVQQNKTTQCILTYSKVFWAQSG